jgi:hypothetical protein
VVRTTEGALARAGVPRPQVLLVLGHMRSGSTLLLHVLLDHPQIEGLGERNAVYQSSDDLARLVVETRVRRRAPFVPLRYVVDQVNHTRLTPSPRLLGDPRVHVLFLVREPAATLASLIALTRTYYQPWSVLQAADYYIERLDALTAYARDYVASGRAGFVTYEGLTRMPEPTLAGLQGLLGTTPAFRDTYRLHGFTGKRGDPGAAIRTGRIQDRDPGATQDLPAAEIARARVAYERCLDAMRPIALRLAPPARR